jgi:ketosteroid isomerase-like protein
MDESNIEVLSLMTGEWNRRGFDAMVEDFWHEDVEWIDAPDMPDAITTHGRDEVAARIQSIRDVLGHWELEILEIRPTGEEFFIEYLITTGEQPSGAVTRQHWYQLYRLQGGKAIRIRNFTDRDQALAAAESP